MTLSDGMWSGQSCLIVGGGPSLRGHEKRLAWAADTLLPNGGDFRDGAERALGACIAINRAFEFVNYPDIWLAADSVYWRKKAPESLHEQARRYGVPRVWVDHGERHPGPDKVDLVLPCAAPPGTPNRHAAMAWGRSLEEGVGAGGNSGFAALNLADILGAETIYLLGFDLRGENGKTANWHDGYGPKEVANESIYDRFLESFRWAATKCRARVVVLEVKQGDSRLDCWEKRLAEEVL